MKEFLRLDVPDKINLKGGGEKASSLLLKAMQDLDISTDPNLLVQNSWHFSVDNSQTPQYQYCTSSTLQDSEKECSKIFILTACSG